MMTTPILVVYALFLAAMLVSLAYFRRYRMPQPPLGVMNLWDVALTMVVIILIPHLHLWLPPWANTVFLSLVTASLLYFLLEPVVHARALRWVITLGLVAAGVAAAYLLPGGSVAYVAINDILILLSVVAISNLWAQSGVRARDLVVLALAIAAYDFIFTGRLPVTADLFAQLDNLPFAPLLAWGQGAERAAIGLGDTLMASAFVLALYKAWGRRAAALGFAAMALSFPLLFVLPLLGGLFLTAAYPAMVVIAPVQWLVYLFCRRRYGAERTMGEYRAALG
jgi:hypothetical protein